MPRSNSAASIGFHRPAPGVDQRPHSLCLVCAPYEIINTADNFICGLVIKVHDCYSLLVKLSDSFMVLQSYIGWVSDFVRVGSAVRTAHFATVMWLTPFLAIQNPWT